MFNPWSPPPQWPLHWWQGTSGQLHCFSVYPRSDVPSWLGCCNYIFVRRRYGLADSHQPVYIGQTSGIDRFRSHEKLGPALRIGATELHVSFAAQSQQERMAIETNLHNAYQTPLNIQPSRAPTPVNALGGVGPLGMPPARGGIPAPAPAPHPRNGLTDALES